VNEIKNIAGHKDYELKDGRTDALYLEIMELITKKFNGAALTPTEAIGTLDWVKTVIIMTNTNFNEEL
tara:strand:+ start:14312 stop:14515 length:204 start_codon:yes stop_codon:yes gene_type:complete